MKRPARKLALFLLLLLVGGAIINIAVAWGWWIGLTVDDLHQSLGEAALDGYATNTIVYKQLLFTAEMHIPLRDRDDRLSFRRWSQGWPLRSLACTETWDNGLCSWSYAACAPQYPHGPFALLPIWPCFAINTVFYAALLWLMFAAPFALRRRSRRRRGLCPACAYPVGESDVCTECGKPVRKHKAEIRHREPADATAQKAETT